MATSTVEAEKDFVAIHRGKVVKKIEALLRDEFGDRDTGDFADSLAEALDLEVEEVPKFNVEVRLTIGNQVISVSGFEVEEKDE